MSLVCLSRSFLGQRARTNTWNESVVLVDAPKEKVTRDPYVLTGDMSVLVPSRLLLRAWYILRPSEFKSADKTTIFSETLCRCAFGLLESSLSGVRTSRSSGATGRVSPGFGSSV